MLSFASEAVTYRELLLTGAATGVLWGLVVEAAAGERLTRSSPEGPPRDAVRAEAQRFRRARHLESGEDLRVWLASRGLTLDEFDQYISRVVARANAGSNEPDTECGELSPKLLFSELACSGAWRAFADTAARLFAAERLSRQGNPIGAGPEPGQAMMARNQLGRPPAEVLEVLRPFGAFDPAWCDERLRVLRSRALALEDIERQIRGSEAVKARIEDYRMEWALFRYDELPLRSQAAAMEALSCARGDRLPADEIARRAATDLTPRRARREDLPAGHAALLDGAAQDEAVGPLSTRAAFLSCGCASVRGLTAPTPRSPGEQLPSSYPRRSSEPRRVRSGRSTDCEPERDRSAGLATAPLALKGLTPALRSRRAAVPST